jgi:S1-C subfamily serine protease
MWSVVNKVFKVIVNVVRVLIKTLFVAVMVLNMVMIVGVAELITDIDAKTDTMAQAFMNYQKTTLPNFENLVRANVYIVNVTQGCAGSGTTINVDGKTYIVSAGHLDDPTDTFFVKQGDEYRPIKLVKVNHEVDLALFEYVGAYCDLTIAPIAVEEPRVGDRIWAVGNPAGLEDAITSGTLVRKMNFSYLIDAKIYYGSSGGGLFNTKGELIGVNVAMVGTGTYLLGMSVNLRTIKAFILGNIPSDI